MPVEVELAGLDTHAYVDVYPYFEHRETTFEAYERSDVPRYAVPGTVPVTSLPSVPLERRIWVPPTPLNV